MKPTNTRPEKDTDDETSCDESWCDGPETEPLPCFECYAAAPTAVNDRYVHPWDEPAQPHHDDRQVWTTPEQVVTGLPLGLATLEVRCFDCGRRLGEGAAVHVYAYRAAEAPRWSITQCYCRECAPNSIRKPTLGTSEVLILAQLGVVANPAEQRHALCVCDPEVTSFSPPTRGSAP